MIRRIKNRNMFEARLRKGIKSIFDEYQRKIGSGLSPYLIYDINNRENSLELPYFSTDEIRSVQDAVDNSDVSLCIDVLDKIDDCLEDYNRRKREIEPIADKLQGLWEQFLNNVNNLSDDVIFIHDGDWVSAEDVVNHKPLFYAVELNDDAERHLENLRDAILALLG